MPRLEGIRGPQDLRALSPHAARELASQIRRLLVDTCTANGGHLGPNLGVVELSIALYRDFDSPRDKILWDTGHQAYVHKILTGRTEALATLRRTGGMSGTPAAPSPSTTSSRTRTPRPPCPGRTASPAPTP